MVSRPWPISVAITASAAVMVAAAAVCPAVFLRCFAIPAPGSAASVQIGAVMSRRLVLDKLARSGWLCATFSPIGMSMHRYRTHTCGALRESDIGIEARLSGWCHRIRDHGGVLFIDLRDHYGITQVVADPDSPAFKVAETLRSEWVVHIDGSVRARPEGTVNAELPTGEVELFATEIEVLSAAKELPIPVFGEPDYPEDLRLTYRFLDLRRETLHSTIRKRLEIIKSIRSRMHEAGF